MFFSGKEPFAPYWARTENYGVVYKIMSNVHTHTEPSYSGKVSGCHEVWYRKVDSDFFQHCPNMDISKDEVAKLIRLTEKESVILDNKLIAYIEQEKNAKMEEERNTKNKYEELVS